MSIGSTIIYFIVPTNIYLPDFFFFYDAKTDTKNDTLALPMVHVYELVSTSWSGTEAGSDLCGDSWAGSVVSVSACGREYGPMMSDSSVM